MIKREKMIYGTKETDESYLVWKTTEEAKWLIQKQADEENELPEIG